MGRGDTGHHVIISLYTKLDVEHGPVIDDHFLNSLAIDNGYGKVYPRVTYLLCVAMFDVTQGA